MLGTTIQWIFGIGPSSQCTDDKRSTPLFHEMIFTDSIVAQCCTTDRISTPAHAAVQIPSRSCVNRSYISSRTHILAPILLDMSQSSSQLAEILSQVYVIFLTGCSTCTYFLHSIFTNDINYALSSKCLYCMHMYMCADNGSSTGTLGIPHYLHK